MPAVPPKLPSIWNGRVGVEEVGQGVARPGPRSSILWAWSPSSSRAQKLIFQALLQPVPPSPRKISDCRAAANSSGVPRGVISQPGMQAPEVRHVPVLVLRVVHVLEPLLELAVLADLVGRDLRAAARRAARRGRGRRRGSRRPRPCWRTGRG